MKKTILSLFALACSMGMSAQQMSTIQGRLSKDDANVKQMFVYEVENAECREIAASRVDKNGNFAFAFFPEKEGFYVVGRNPRMKTGRYIFYLKPGDNVRFAADRASYSLVGDNTPENKEMARWHDALKEVEYKSLFFNLSQSTFRDFFPEFQQLLPSLQKYPKAKTKNKDFNAAFEDFRRYNLCDYALAYLYTPRTEHPKAADYIDYYRQLRVADYTRSVSLLDYPDGLDMISNIQMTLFHMDASLTQEQMSARFKTFRDDAIASIADPVVKGEYVIANAGSVKTYPGIVDYNEKYGQYLVNDDQKARMQQIIAKLDKNEPGNAAAPFTLPDTNGKMHSLADWRGKLVYIDFWATWCGPCKGEIPFMTKLEEEYAGNKDIVFVSVSVDKEADRQKWLDMVKEKGMKGVQLFTGDLKGQVSEPYHINTIPRFVLVGRDGKLINGNAPRPSSEEIRPLINFHLKK